LKQAIKTQIWAFFKVPNIRLEIPVPAPLLFLPKITRSMISSAVTDNRQAAIYLTVRNPAGQEQEIEAIIDTGFGGWLTLPSFLVSRLGSVWLRRGDRKHYGGDLE
jgi:hypothetical protein